MGMGLKQLHGHQIGTGIIATLGSMMASAEQALSLPAHCPRLHGCQTGAC